MLGIVFLNEQKIKTMAKDKEYEQISRIERLNRSRIRKQKRREKKGTHKTCPQCGHETNDYVGYRIDPFYYDMYGEIREVRMCQDCYNNSCGDI